MIHRQFDDVLPGQFEPRWFSFALMMVHRRKQMALHRLQHLLGRSIPFQHTMDEIFGQKCSEQTQAFLSLSGGFSKRSLPNHYSMR